MSTIINRFSKNLKAIEYPKKKTSWNIAGIIKGQNAFFKFALYLFQTKNAEKIRYPIFKTNRKVACRLCNPFTHPCLFTAGCSG